MKKKENNNIQVSVSSVYLEDHSDPSEDSFLWAYQVKIKNNGLNTPCEITISVVDMRTYPNKNYWFILGRIIDMDKEKPIKIALTF